MPDPKKAESKPDSMKHIHRMKQLNAEWKKGFKSKERFAESTNEWMASNARLRAMRKK
jgi:hypothetical protein